MFRLFRILFITLVFATPIIPDHRSVFAQTAADSLLASYVHEAWQSHPDLEAMRAMVTAESSRTVMSRAWMNPEFRAGLMNAPTDFDLNKDPMTMFQIGAMQQIPFPGKRGAASQAGEARTGAAGARVRTSEFDMAEMVAMAYYDLAAALATRQSLERGLELTETMTQSAAAMLSSGMGSQADVLRARLETEQWNQRLVSNQAMIDRKRAALAYAVGRNDVQSLIDPILPDDLPDLPDLPAALTVESLNETPEVQQALQQTRAANADVRRARLGYWPDLSVGLAYGIRGDLKTEGRDPHTGAPAEEVMDQDNMITMEVAIPLPLFYRGNQRAEVSERRAMQRGAEQDVARTRLAKIQELRELHALLQEKLANHRIAADTVLPQAEDTWRATILDYRAAKLPFMTLAEARMSVVMTEMDAIMLRAEAWATYYRWQAALGKPIQ